MKQLCYIFLFIISLWSNNSLFAQSYKLSDLCVTEWNVESGIEGLEEYYFFWSFDSKMLNVTIRLREDYEDEEEEEEGDYNEEFDSEEDILCPYDMYLSDAKQDTFDSSKIGKSTKEKYIIIHNTYELIGETFENFHCYEIVKLTPKELIVKYYNKDIVLSAKSSE